MRRSYRSGVFLFMISLMVMLCHLDVFAEEKTSADGNWQYKIEKEYDENGSREVMTLTRYLGNLTDVTVPSSIDGYHVGKLEYTFWNMDVEKVVIPDGVTSLTNAFYYCSKLTEVSLPGSVNDYTAAFMGCTSLGEIVLPTGTYSLHDSFNGCTNLKKIAVLGTVRDLANTFRDCKNLQSVTISGIDGNLEYFDCSCAFSGCEKIASISVPDNCRSLHYVFEKCENLTTVYLPETITDIYMAFEYCYKLKDIYYAGSECRWAGMDKSSSGADRLGQATVHFAKPTVHDFGDWSISKEAACTEKGEKRRVCNICGFEEIEEINEHGHDFTGWGMWTEPTCVENGIEKRNCVYCGLEEERQIAAIPLEIGKSREEIAKAKTVKIKLPAALKNAKVTSSNKKIATASVKNGILTVKTRKKYGKTKIILEGRKKAELEVTVPKVKTQKITCKAISVKKGKTKKLKVTISPRYCDDKITYKIKNKKIATVSAKGAVKGIRKGTTTVTIKSGKKKKVVKITVK